VTILGLEQSLCPSLKFCAVVFSEQTLKLALTAVSRDPLCLQWEQGKAERQCGEMLPAWRPSPALSNWELWGFAIVPPTRLEGTAVAVRGVRVKSVGKLGDGKARDGGRELEPKQVKGQSWPVWAGNFSPVQGDGDRWATQCQLTVSVHKRFSVNRNKSGTNSLEVAVSHQSQLPQHFGKNSKFSTGARGELTPTWHRTREGVLCRWGVCKSILGCEMDCRHLQLKRQNLASGDFFSCMLTFVNTVQLMQI